MQPATEHSAQPRRQEPPCLRPAPHPLLLHASTHPQTYIAYRFNSNAELKTFQDCQSVQSLFINNVLNKGYKTPLVNPPKYFRC